ncbi:MAG: TerB family tellurite resistance protein [Pseudomonadota bacterium]
MLSNLINRLQQPERERDPAHLEALAAAALLLEVAWSDHEITEAELRLIEEHLEKQLALSHAEVAELVEESRQAHEESVGVYGYTRTINECWDEEHKFRLVTALWRLALADEDLSRYEEHTIRKISELLYLTHPRYIEAKLTAKRDAGLA